jgi:hypothetical protein
MRLLHLLPLVLLPILLPFVACDGETPTPTPEPEACVASTECDTNQGGFGSLAVCCQGTCEYGIFIIDDPCETDSDCLSNVCTFANETTCIGSCEEGCGGSGSEPCGTGGGGGGVGGSGASGGGGAGPAIPPNTTVSGDYTVDNNGCLSTQGAGTTPAHIALDAAATGPVTVVVAGEMAPVVGGVAADPASVVQVCNGGLVAGNTVTGCHLGRGNYNSVNQTGSAGVFDTNFTEVDAATWTPVGTVHPYELTVNADASGETLAVELRIDGNVVATASGAALGAPGGTTVSVLFAQSTVCSIAVTPN